MNTLDRVHSTIAGGGATSRAFARAHGLGVEPLPTKDQVTSATIPVLARRPLVSVVIPCYNYARFLGPCVDSVLRQDGVDTEIVVVDDASIDDTATVAGELAARHENVHVLRNDVNRGHVETFNVGCARASGEFVTRLDADDLLTPGALWRAAAIFERYPSVGLVYGHPEHFSTDTPPRPRTRLAGWTVWDGRVWLRERCRVGVNCITTPEAVVRAEILADVGALSTELRFAQDMEFWLRIAAVADVARIDGPDQALHRDHAASMSATVGAGVLTDLRERRRVFEVLFAGVAGRLPDADGLRALADRALARQALDRACRAFDRGRAAEESIQEWIDFALQTYPEVVELAEWRALNRRRSVGPRLAPMMPQFLTRALTRRLAEELAYAHWVRTGL